jgi:hypothetical protein
MSVIMYAYSTQITEHIVKLLQEAKQSVYGCVPAFSNVSVFEALCHCAKKGVQVGLVVQKSQTAVLPLHQLVARGGAVQMLSEEVFVQGSVYTNYCIIDEICLIYGSYKWSDAPNQNFAESILVVNAFENDTLVGFFLTQFRELWQTCLQQQEPAVVPYSEILKIQIQALELECAFLEAEIQEIRAYYKHITEYIQLQLGGLILKKLQLEAEIEKKKAEKLRKNIYQESYAQKQQAYHAFREKFEAFQERVREIEEKVQHKPLPELKELYKKLIKQIHPDLFVDNPEIYAKATEMMVLLNEAYSKQDLNALLALEVQISNSTWLGSTHHQDNTSTWEEWEKKLIFWQQRKKELYSALQDLKNQNFYSIFTGQVTLEAYCHQLKLQLEADIRILTQNLGSL